MIVPVLFKLSILVQDNNKALIPTITNRKHIYIIFNGFFFFNFEKIAP